MRTVSFVLTCLLSLSVMVAGTSASAVTAAPALMHSDTPNCVTKTEWRRVYIVPDGTGRGPGDGGTMARVHRIFDIDGRRTWFFDDGDRKHQVRAYNRCGSTKRYKVTYIKYRQRAWWSYWG